MLSKCRKILEGTKEHEHGAVMLEGMIVVIITIFMLVWILGIGFVYYQRYTVTIVTNDVAVKIASTYNNPTSDIIMGYVTTEDLSERDLYRNYSSDDSELLLENEERTSNYVKYILDKANFSGTVENVDVDLELVADSALRKHVKVTTTCTFNTPFGEILDYFGMEGQLTYQSTACADCTDVAEYVSTVSFMKVLGSGSYLDDEKLIQNFIKMINSFVKAYNHFAS